MGCGQSDNSEKEHTISSTNPLLNKHKMGSLELRNRIVMASMTRCRADPLTSCANDMHVTHYSARADTAGLVITESSPVSRRGTSYPGAPAIYSNEHAVAWKKVTDAVHQVNGRIFIQLFHAGRTARSSSIGGLSPIGPSAIRMRTQTEGDKFDLNDEVEELTAGGIAGVVAEFKRSAEYAKQAGFDGVQLSAGGGYIVDQFLCDATNNRNDKYGGSIENRVRFLLEVIDALTQVFPADRVGIKITPGGRYNDMFDSEPVKLHSHLLKELTKRKICFVEITQLPEPMPVGNLYGIKGVDQVGADACKVFRPLFTGTLIANSDFSFESGNAILKNNNADMVSYGRHYISNPDLVERFKNGWNLTEVDYKTAYYGGVVGYNDYAKYTSK